MRAAGTYVYEYDYENRLARVTTGATISGTCNETTTGGTTVAVYKYDPMGRRMEKSTGGTTTTFVYDEARVIEEYQGGTSPVRTYTYGAWIDEVLSMVTGGSRYYYHTNTLGTVGFLTNNSGTIVEGYRYSAYGIMDVLTSTGGDSTWFTPDDTVVGTSAIGNPYAYTGREYDNETGLYYYRARYYSPTQGRFLQRDPLGYVDGMSLYEYVQGNSINYLDPYGSISEIMVDGWLTEDEGLWEDLSLASIDWSLGLSLKAKVENKCKLKEGTCDWSHEKASTTISSSSFRIAVGDNSVSFIFDSFSNIKIAGYNLNLERWIKKDECPPEGKCCYKCSAKVFVNENTMSSVVIEVNGNIDTILGLIQPAQKIKATIGKILSMLMENGFNIEYKSFGAKNISKGGELNVYACPECEGWVDGYVGSSNRETIGPMGAGNSGEDLSNEAEMNLSVVCH